jgi:hypothetical protein
LRGWPAGRRRVHLCTNCSGNSVTSWAKSS